MRVLPLCSRIIWMYDRHRSSQTRFQLQKNFVFAQDENLSTIGVTLICLKVILWCSYHIKLSKLTALPSSLCYQYFSYIVALRPLSHHINSCVPVGALIRFQGWWYQNGSLFFVFEKIKYIYGTTRHPRRNINTINPQTSTTNSSSS